MQWKTFSSVFSVGQKKAVENKDEWSHWLQIWPLESTARALSSAIYYIHEHDLWGVRGSLRRRWWVPTCSTQHLRHWLPGDQTGLLCSPPLFPEQVPYRRRLTHFSSLAVPLPGENSDLVCVCVCDWWVALQGWTKSFSCPLAVQTGYRRNHVIFFLSDTIACVIVSVIVSHGGGLYASACLQSMLPELIQIYCINWRGLIGVCSVDLKSALQGTNLPNKWVICSTPRDQMKAVILRHIYCAGLNCLQSLALIWLILINSDSEHNDTRHQWPFSLSPYTDPPAVGSFCPSHPSYLPAFTTLIICTHFFMSLSL